MVHGLLALRSTLDAAWLLPDAPRHDAAQDAWRVSDKADVPLITASFRALDGLVEGPGRPRTSRDPAAQTHAAPAPLNAADVPAAPSPMDAARNSVAPLPTP